MGTDVFISYSHRDRDKTVQLAQALEQAGKSVWWDPQILPGQHYQSTIQDALHQAGCVVTAWTPDSINSNYVRAESLWGFDKGKLISVKLDDVHIPTPFNAIHVADLRYWQGDIEAPVFQQLVKGIDWLCQNPVRPVAVKDRPEPEPGSASEKSKSAPEPRPGKLSEQPSRPDSVVAVQSPLSDSRRVDTPGTPQALLSDKSSPNRAWLFMLLGFTAVLAVAGFYFMYDFTGPGAHGTTSQTWDTSTPPATGAAVSTGYAEHESPETPATDLQKRLMALLPYLETADDCSGDFNAPNRGYMKDYFHKAAAAGYLEGLQRCYQLGASVNIREINQWTPLHSAAQNNQDQAVKRLLNWGADRKLVDVYGKTPLDIARLAKADKVIPLLEE
ncbi:MAG: TIR domain-containing protein [Thiolinea sp.]